jgi:hypothetical protein
LFGVAYFDKEELHRQRKEFFFAGLQEDYKTGRCNYRGISLLSNLLEILHNIILSKLAPYEEEIIGPHHYEFRSRDNNASATHGLHASL